MKRYLSTILFFVFLSLTYLCDAQQLIQYNLDVKEGNSFYYINGVNSDNSIRVLGIWPTKEVRYNFTTYAKGVKLRVASFMNSEQGCCVSLMQGDIWKTYKCFPQNNPDNEYLEVNVLPPGVYSIVVQGAAENGYITTRIECIDPLEFNLGEKDSSFEYTHTQNTNEWTTGTTNGVLYRINAKKKSNLKITNTTAFSSGSQISLLNETKTTTIATKDFPQNNSLDNALLVKDLPIGVYYVISKGKNQEGTITSHIEGIFPTEYDLGVINENFDYSHTQNTGVTTNEWNNKPTNDVMYKIEIPKQMNIRISNSTSLASGSCIGLLNSTKLQTIASKTFPKDNFLGNNEYVEIMNVQPGTYYIVSEGASENGIIVTHIRTYNSILNDNANYVATRTNLGDAAQTTLNEFHYFDGLGSFIQSVKQKMTPNGGDLVVTQEYDEFGRESNTWLPSPIQNNNGHNISLDRIKINTKLFYADDSVFSKQIYETSPLNRVTEQYGPGVAWYSAGKSVKTAWSVNTASGELSCTLYAIASSTSLQRKGMYATGELYVTKATGEDDHVSYTFTDKLGRTILERVMDGTIMNDTYYIYDNYNNLRYVLPPSASGVLTSNTTWADNYEPLMNYAYIYKYDGRNRCVKKFLPGRDPIEVRYDKADRLVFSQDGNQKLRKEWTFIFYDALDRQTVSGIWKSETVPALDNAVVTNYTGSGSLGGYTVSLTSLPPLDLMTVNYYDNYTFLNLPMSALKDSLVFLNKGYDAQFASAKGLTTGTRMYQLSDPSKYSVSAIYYDHWGRVVQSRTSNHVGGYDGEYFMYTFTGKVKQRMLIHSANNNTQVETYYYNYGTPSTNPAERLLDVKHKLSPNTVQTTLAVYTYDEVSRVKTKKLATETSTYSYNTRSWLTQLTGTKFNQTLTYNAAVNGVTPSKALYSGNISAMKWKSGDETTERGYKFTYDGLSRLATASYGEGTAITTNLNRFNENVTYNDKMGNIKTLKRRGKLNSGYGDMDNLTYTYTGNQLTKVTDAVTTPITYENAFHFVDRANVANEYTYDKNGNLTKDLNKNITSITYNALNLPQVITYSNGNTATYIYDGSGSKLSVAYKSGTTTTKTEYVGNKVYKNGTISMLVTEEGYATLSGTTPTYYYYLKDHQGNNRVVINQSGAVQQVNHYYAFGGLFGEGIQSSNQPYKYNGKELDRLNGLDMYDYGARHYDAALGRWFTVDPLAEKYYNISPYVYVVNNPVKFIDPTGMYVVEEDEERKKKFPTVLQKMYESFNYVLERLVFDMGMHPAQIQSENPAILEDASNRRKELAETVHTINETMLSPIPGAETAYKISMDREVSKGDVALELMGVVPFGKLGVAAKTSMSSGEFLFNTWHKGTFANRTQSVMYHVGKHGNGRTAVQYTEDAMSFFNKNKGLGQNMILKDGTQGIKIQTKQIINGKTQRVGGYWTADGKLVTFWD